MLVVLLVFLSLISPLSAVPEGIDPHTKAISYDKRSRLGNQLITYLCAKWIAHQYQLPFLYVPLSYGDQFMFHEQERYQRADWEARFQRTITPERLSEIPRLPDSTLILINCFWSDPLDRARKKIDYHQFWHDPAFREFVRPLLQPRFPIQTLNPPRDRLTVLAHVRMGSGKDTLKTQLNYPAKFPPLSFYIAAVEALSDQFGHPSMYVHVMTDDLQPQTLVEQFSRALSHRPNLEFGFRPIDDNPSVMEDFFSIPKFDCLIRGNSTFSIAASLLADHQATVTPQKCRVKEGKVVFNGVKIKLNK